MNKDYGVLFSLWVCRHNVASVGSFAKKFKLPIKDVRKMANKLKINGFMSTKRGRFGGYSLVGRPTVKSIAGACVQ